MVVNLLSILAWRARRGKGIRLKSQAACMLPTTDALKKEGAMDLVKLLVLATVVSGLLILGAFALFM